MRAALLLSALALPAGAPPAATAPPTQVHKAVLTCGAGTFRLASLEWTARAAPLAPAAQSLAVIVGDRRRPLRLEVARPVVVDGWRVRRRYVLSWACLQASTGRAYVSLGYACAVDPAQKGSCGPDKEWFRLLDDQGRSLDAGLPRAGSAQQRLKERLGLNTVMEAGVSMKDVLGG